MKKISVVVLAYNEEDSIVKCLDSILVQSHKPFEIIVVNDGSTDNTLNVLKSYKNKIRIINKQKNEGRPRAYISGFEEATGDVVAFIDGDSYAPKTWLKDLAEVFEKATEKTACVGGFYHCSNIEHRIPRLEEKYNQAAIAKNRFKFPSGSNMAYDKKISQKLGIFKKLPAFRCDRYAMDMLIKEGYSIKLINSYVFSKAPNTFCAYLKQRFRWGRGAPSAKLIKTKTLLQKIIVTISPIPLLLLLILYPVYALATFIITFLLSGVLFSRIFDKITFLDALQLLDLKLAGHYAHSFGYIYEIIRGSAFAE